MHTLILEHPLAVILVCCFALIQLGAFVFLIRQTLRMLRQLRALPESRQRTQSAFECVDLPFITWCRLPTGGGVLHAPEQRRDTALAEVDQWFTGLPAFQLLSRSGHIAPLMGVLITAFGFLGSKALTDSEPAEQLLRTVSPLVLGIAGGASLAILSQVFLFTADTIYGRIRRAANECFSQLSWTEDQNNTTQAITDLVSVSRELKSVFADVPTKLALLMGGIDRTDKTLKVVGTLMESVATRFTDGVSAFENTVSSDLTPLLRQHAASVDTTKHVVEQCRKSLEDFASAAQLLENVGVRQAEINENYAKSLSEIILPTHRQLSDAAKKVTAITTTLGKPLDAFVTATSGFADSLSESTAGIKDFKRVAELFGQGVQAHFLPAIEGHHSSVMNLEAVSGGLRAANDSFVRELVLLAKAAESHRDVGVRLVELIEEHTVPAHELLSGCAKRFEETSVELSHFVDGYNDSVLRHAEGVDRVAHQIGTALHRMTDASDRMSHLIATVESRILDELAEHSVTKSNNGRQEQASCAPQPDVVASDRIRRPQLEAPPATSPNAVSVDTLGRSVEAPNHSASTTWWFRRS